MTRGQKTRRLRGPRMTLFRVPLSDARSEDRILLRRYRSHCRGDWMFILPEVACRTPGEIDEMFEERVNVRKLKNYVTRVQLQAEEVQGEK